MKHIRVYGLWCVLMIVCAPLFATTIVMPTDEQLIAKSPVIIEGTVASTNPIARGNAIWTETVIDVAKTIKGNVANTITVREMGGVIDNRITKIFGAPEFSVGEHVLLFLTPTPRGDYQTTDLYVGKFTEERTLNGRMLWSRHDEAADVVLLDSTFNPIPARNVQRDANAFTTYVADRVAGHRGANNYGVENPVLDSITDGNNGGGRAKDFFTVIAEPTIYRWFALDSGASVKWYSYGTQPGYTGGGVNEIQTAMGAWNGYAAAKINYQYSGVESGAPAGLSATNGVNEVLFNDPLQEIAGSWNPSTGGIVGQGGFNGVAGAQLWDAPFTADATHTQKTYNAWNITEGNLVIQDNVSPSQGLSSARLAEIVAHEFGHTLGFGHSIDTTALMYPTVTGLGASLRADDQLGARWLYPSGAQTPPPPPTTTIPNAPSGLTASIVSGSNVSLSWTDNATNETGESIYVSVAGGAFSKVTDVAANTTAATLTGFASGSYSFYVSAFNSAGNSAPSNTATVNFGASLQAAFSVNAISGIAGQTNFVFTDQSTGTITSRLWVFGDGFTSSVQNPTHVFSIAGQYNVTLTVNGNGGSSSTSRTIFVTAPAQQLSAAFTWTPSSPTTAQDVQFADQSSGGVTSWQWSFGDGTTATSQNPAKRFTSAGAYTVSLTASGNGQTSSVSHTVVVTNAVPVTPPVSAAFTWTPSNIATKQTVTFSDASTGAPASWLWNFGDGFSSTQQSAQHSYNVAGAYTVTLTVSNATSSSTISHVIIVTQATFTTRSLVSASAQTNGVGGSVWRTELTLFNAGEAASINLIFIPGNGAILSHNIILGANQSVTYANALLDIFGLSGGAGAIAVESTSTTSTPNIKITSRTFTNGAIGTYGQSVPDVTGDDLQTTTYLTALAANASYRTNIGLVNRGDVTGNAVLQLYDANGAFIGAASVNVPPSSFQQNSLASYIPQAASVTLDGASMIVTSSSPGAVSVYASVIDNRTQDPIYVQASAIHNASSTIIPAVGRAGGLNGTFWRSDVTFFNPGSATSVVSMRLLASGSDNRSAQWQTFAVGGGQTLVLADVASRFTGTANSSGALELQWTNPIAVTSRTYTTDANGGTYGQSIDPVAAFGSNQYIPGLRSDASFRTNAGFVNSGDQTIGVTLSLISSGGSTIATGFVAVPPKSQVQYSLSGLFPGLNVNALGSVTLRASTDTAPTLFAYGSIVDNVSGDPVFFAGK